MRPTAWRGLRLGAGGPGRDEAGAVLRYLVVSIAADVLGVVCHGRGRLGQRRRAT
jgi:hypothetical protein